MSCIPTPMRCALAGKMSGVLVGGAMLSLCSEKPTVGQ